MAADPASDLLAKVEQTYRAARSFRLAASYRTQTDDALSRMYRISLNAERHGRLAISLTASPGSDAFTLLNDGKQFVIYSAAPKTILHAVSGSAAQIDAASQILELLATQYESFALRGHAVLSGSDSWTLNGAPILCTVLRIGVEGAGSTTEFWVDNARFLVVRQIYRPGDNAKPQAYSALELSAAQLDLAPGPTDFTFSPPAGAREVDWLLPPDLPLPGIPHLPHRPSGQSR
jgi:outer membrane lipoprotein-sorting protein